jgi:hypothetical protein
MVTDTATKAYFELCDTAYEQWKLYTQSCISVAKPYTQYWESLRK